MINKTLSVLSGDRLGQFKAAPSAQWEAGQVVYLATGSLVTLCATANVPAGLAANNHYDTLTRAIVDEATTALDYSNVEGARTATLAHTNLVAGSEKFYLGAVALADTTDYTLVDSTGVITAVASGKLDSVGGSASYTDGIVTATYRYYMTVAEKNGFLNDVGTIVGGPGIQNNFDEVTAPDKETTIFGNGCLVYTDQFDTTDVFTVGVKVYCDANGRLTITDGGSQVAVGRVFEVPTATKPWLGVKVNIA